MGNYCWDQELVLEKTNTNKQKTLGLSLGLGAYSMALGGLSFFFLIGTWAQISVQSQACCGASGIVQLIFLTVKWCDGGDGTEFTG